MPDRTRVLYVTDLAYQARGRRYCDEDIFLTSRLREDFDIALCHPLQAAALMDAFDLVVVRNSGPVMGYQDAYRAFRERAATVGAKLYNPLSGRGDMAGKQYLLDLTTDGFPVIPTIDRLADLHLLPEADEYAVKPKTGSDSIGLAFAPRDRLADLVHEGLLIQPRIDFRYEVSFYYIDNTFHYALYAPDPAQRWDLAPYEPTADDLAFAHRFTTWNSLDHGIQRVDACRTPTGDLLLVELEDLNPYLSLDLLPGTTRDTFVTAMTNSLHRLATT